MNERNCKCPQSRLVAGVHCGSSTVVPSSLTHGTREVFGWNMTKVCSFVTLHEALLSLFNAERFETLANEAYTVRIGKTASSSLSQSCNDPVSFTFSEIIESYGLPVFVQYQVVPLPAASVTAVNAWEILMQEPHLQWPEKSWKDINAKIDLKVDFQTWLEEGNGAGCQSR